MDDALPLSVARETEYCPCGVEVQGQTTHASACNNHFESAYLFEIFEVFESGKQSSFAMWIEKGVGGGTFLTFERDVNCRLGQSVEHNFVCPSLCGEEDGDGVKRSMRADKADNQTRI